MSGTPGGQLESLIAIARQAGAVVMRHYQAGTEVRLKSDHSPVTDADEDAEAVILEELARAFAGVPVVAEEQAAAGRIVAVGARFFLVDPLDGTREFLSRNGEFTVNIAEIVDGRPVAGVVFAPALDRLFAGAMGEGAFELSKSARHAIAARVPAADGLVAVSSRSHPDPRTAELLARLTIKDRKQAGSSLKFCLLAAGEADIYPRAGRTMEWDTAAGHAVLAAAGGHVTGWDGEAFVYGKPGFENGPFIARGKTS